MASCRLLLAAAIRFARLRTRGRYAAAAPRDYGLGHMDRRPNRCDSHHFDRFRYRMPVLAAFAAAIRLARRLFHARRARTHLGDDDGPADDRRIDSHCRRANANRRCADRHGRSTRRHHRDGGTADGHHCGASDRRTDNDHQNDQAAQNSQHERTLHNGTARRVRLAKNKKPTNHTRLQTRKILNLNGGR